MNRTRVLIVDDEPDVVASIRFALESEGIECLEAENGPAALKLAIREHPDLILLDIMMPDMNGFEVAKLLKFNEEYRGIIIVMLTARTQFEDIAVGVETGADEYITKPFDMDFLVREVKQQLHRRFRPVAPAPKARARPPRKRILIVDDEPDVAHSVRYRLEFEGFECLVAEDGAQALEMARRDKPDLILLDVMLPKITGYGVARLLRLDDACRDVPVLMVTGIGPGKYARWACESGVDEYITKPFDMDALVARIRQLLNLEPEAANTGDGTPK